MQRNYLDELNESQRAAVQCTEGPVMIVAGAGSGKTRVLTYRIAHLVKGGVDSFNILALTFTNKAARAMKERIARIVGPESRNLWMGTFHSVFARMLRAEADKLNYPSNFTIYDTDDSKSLIKAILKEQGIDDKVYKPSSVLARISQIKTLLISHKDYSRNEIYIEDDKLAGRPHFGTIFSLYCKRCFKAGAMDFDDLLFNTNILLRDFPEVLFKYQNKFKYILVDEYQDTNHSQYEIVKRLAARFQNICVVGDDAQSIYAFRGANIRNILNFEKDYPDMKTFKLEQNYRSTQTIVKAANGVIAKNKEQLKKVVWTDNEKGEQIKLLRALTDNEEGIQVAQEIFSIKMNRQAKNKEFAILYRTNAQSRPMEEALRRNSIPYKIYGGLSFYQRKEIKDMLAYFRLAVNPNDEESLARVINYPARGIGETTIGRIRVAASDNDIGIWTVLENLKDFSLDINAGIQNKLADFVTMIKSFGVMLTTHNAYDLGYHIAKTTGILKELYDDKTVEGLSRYENLEELLNGLKEFSVGEREAPIDLPGSFETQNSETTVSHLRTLDAYMQDIALLTTEDQKGEAENLDVVSLMTVHLAKGLEFPYVFVTGLEENLFPHQFSMDDRADMEEERRLFYVAITRAEKKVTLSFATSRYRWGKLVSSDPSRFLEEIDQQYLDYPKQPALTDSNHWDFDKVIQQKETKNKPKINPHPALKKNLISQQQAKYTNKSFDPSLLKDLQVGMNVQHERFGTGKVVSMEGVFPNNKATVFFDGVGQKQLLLKFARLEILR